MQNRRYPPKLSLSRHISFFWTISDDKPDLSARKLLVPYGSIELIFHLKSPFIATDPNGRAFVQPAAFVAGQYLGAWTFQPTGPYQIIGVRFKPASAQRLFQSSMDTFTGLSVDAESVDPSFTGLHALLFSADTNHRRIDILQRWFGERFAGLDAPNALVEYALECLEESHGNTSLSDIMGTVRVSQRRFEQLFLQGVGISARTLAKKLRFQYAFHQLDGSQSLTRLSYDAGYYDQSHFIRDFRFFTGIAPSTFRKTREAILGPFICG